MKTLTLTIPDNVDLDNSEASMLLACKLYEMGRLSMGQAAELARYSKRTFMELLSRYNTSVFNYDAQDVENDIRNAHSHQIITYK